MIDIAGNKYGKLTVVSLNKVKGTNYYWNTVCDCGNKTVTARGNLVRNRATQCSECAVKTRSLKKATKNMASRHKLYSTYMGMIARCYNTKLPEYKNYGKKGVVVCERWLDSNSGFWNFVTDMGERPEGHTIDRVNPSGDYEPANCRWADRQTQNVNKRVAPKNYYQIGKRWVSYIVRDNKKYHLGTYGTEEKAKDTSSNAAKLYAQGKSLKEIKKELK